MATFAEFEHLSGLAASSFTPSTPVSSRELFAGRWGEVRRVADAVAQTGLHVVIFGERGVGKTSLANVVRIILDVIERSAYDRTVRVDPSTPPPPERTVVKVNANKGDSFPAIWERAFNEIFWDEDRPHVGFSRSAAPQERITLLQHLNAPSPLTADVVRHVLGTLPKSVFVFDEFDRLEAGASGPFTDLIKSLSDHAVDTTIVLVGVAETVEALVRDHQSIQRAISQVPMPRMEAKELREIIENATKSLREKSSVPIEFEAAAIDRIVRISQGLPHYTHLASLHSLRAACDACSEVVGLQHVKEGFRRAVAQADQTTAHSYRVATASAQQDALYRDVLLACAVAAFGSEDPEGYFQPSAVQEPLRVILDRPRVDVSTFNRHLKEFCDRKREKVLERRGQERNYRYRFRLPLMAPYAAIRGMSEDAITYEAFEDLLRRE